MSRLRMAALTITLAGLATTAGAIDPQPAHALAFGATECAPNILCMQIDWWVCFGGPGEQQWLLDHCNLDGDPWDQECSL